MPRKISLAKARERGLTHYFTGKPCKRRHVCNRVVASRACVKCLAVNSAKWYKRGGKKVQRKWRTSPRGRASLNAFYKQWYETPEGKAYLKRKRTSPLGREAQRRANQSPLGLEAQRRYRASPKGIERDFRNAKSPKRVISQMQNDKSPKRLARKYQRTKDRRIENYLNPEHPKFNPGRADFLIAKHHREGRD